MQKAPGDRQNPSSDSRLPPKSESYKIHPGRGSGLVEYTVTQTELRIFREKTQETERVLLQDIQSVRLTYVAGQSLCTIVSSGSRQRVISTRSYRAWGVFHEQRSQYLGFLQSFHERLAGVNSGVRFICGSYFFKVFGLLFIALALGAGALILVQGDTRPSPSLWIVLGVVFLGGVALVPLGSETGYNPRELNEKLLLGIAKHR